MGVEAYRLALPKGLKHWSLRSLQVRLIKMGERIVRHAGHTIFQLAEVAVPRGLFATSWSASTDCGLFRSSEPKRSPLKSGFQAPEMELTGSVERGLIGLNSNEWSVQVCPNLKWEIPAETNRGGLRPWERS